MYRYRRSDHHSTNGCFTGRRYRKRPVKLFWNSNRIGNRFRNMDGLDYFAADGLDLAGGYADVQRAVEHCRRTRRPTFLHLRTTRIMGHAGTDFEIEWRSIEELVQVEPSSLVNPTAFAPL